MSLRAGLLVLAAAALLGGGCVTPGAGAGPPSIDDIVPPGPGEAAQADPPPALVPDGGPRPSPTDERPIDPEPPADAPAGEAQVPGQVDEPGVVEAGDPPPEDYDAELPSLLYLIDDFWARALGDRYVRPSVYPAYEQNGPGTCGPQPLPRRNAVYCSAGHFVSWDESGLLRPYYERGGDMAVAFVLAHEWGHAAQALMRIDFPRTIYAELQADCFAGAFARDVDQQGYLEEGDVEEALRAIFEVADPEDIPWTAPGAHGTFEQRAQYFEYGRENGAQACVDVMARFEA